ncbi:MAG: hypothetical protein ACM3JI_04515 [Anaerolineae bacterium]
MVKFTKSIGIIGGAGPVASAFLYTTILRICQTKFHAHDYSDFPEIILISHPFIRGAEEKICSAIAGCFSRLSAAGASLYCIASHSFHGYLPLLPEKGFINLIEERLNEAKKRKISKPLILASAATISMRLYERPEISCIYPPVADQLHINKLIREVAGGKVHESQSRKLSQLLARLHNSLHYLKTQP